MLKGNARVRLGLATIGLLGAMPVITGCQSVVASTLPPAKYHTAARHAAGMPAQIAITTLTQPAIDVPAPSMPLATEVSTATASSTGVAAPSASDVAAPSGTLDLAGLITGAKGIARGADRIGVELPAMRRAIAISAQALFGIGVLNAVLLFGILHTLRASLRVAKEIRDAAPVHAVAAQPAKPAKQAMEAIVAPAPRTCDCGERISSRSQSGRCRECANAVRSSRAREARPKRRSTATLLGRPHTNGHLSPN